MFYVYKWYNIKTNEIFYIGKGCGNRHNDIKGRNQLFLNYIANNEVANEIIAYFQEEQEALKYEHELILKLKEHGECFCNLDNGGKGGLSFVWTQEMKEYKSKYNPMKDELQRKRMREHNPMYNSETVKKVQATKSKQYMVCYKNEELSPKQLSEKYHIHINTVYKWAKRGYDTKGESCYYKNAPKKNNFKPRGTGIYIDDKYFPSLRAAANFLNVKDTSPLCKCLKSNKKYLGHIVRYANQQPSEENSK